MATRISRPGSHVEGHLAFAFGTVPNIFEAKPEDYTEANVSVNHARTMTSRIDVHALPHEGPTASS